MQAVRLERPRAGPASPDQPIHAPPASRITGSSAVTRPPGLRCHSVRPSGPSTRSTGSRLATTTKLRSAASVDSLVEDIG